MTEHAYMLFTLIATILGLLALRYLDRSLKQPGEKQSLETSAPQKQEWDRDVFVSRRSLAPCSDFPSHRLINGGL